jgi:hypothetical protein
MRKLLFTLLFCSAPCFGQYVFVAAVAAGSANGNSVTTAAMNNTGATCILIAKADLSSLTVTAPTDSSSNTWIGLTQSVTGVMRLRLWYCNPCTVSASQTFSANTTGSVPALGVMSFSGGTCAVDQQGQNGNASGTFCDSAAAPITPSTANQLLVAGLGFGFANAAVASVNSSFLGITQVAGNGTTTFGVAIAYQIQTTATARNPQFTWAGTSTVAAASVGSFQPSTASAVKHRVISGGLQ